MSDSTIDAPYIVYIPCDPKHSEYGCYVEPCPSLDRARRVATVMNRIGAMNAAGRDWLATGPAWSREYDLPSGNVIGNKHEIAAGAVIFQRISEQAGGRRSGAETKGQAE